MGIFSWHCSDRHYLGVPDRYIVGGNWMEFKVLPFSGKRLFTPGRDIDPAQIGRLDRFVAAGDRSWIAILMQQPQGGSFAYLSPWPIFKALDPRWTNKDVLERCVPYNNNQDNLNRLFREWFGNVHERYSKWPS
jgi:hypothetical protein